MLPFESQTFSSLKFYKSSKISKYKSGMIIYEIIFMQNNRDTWNLCSISFSIVFGGKKWKSTDDTKFSQGIKYQIHENK